MKWKAFLQAVVFAMPFIFAVAKSAAQTTAESDFRANCAMCHGKTGAGETPMGRVLKVTPFSDPTVVAMTDSALNNAVINGQGKMQAYSTNLSSTQITNLIQYIRQLQSK